MKRGIRERGIEAGELGVMLRRLGIYSPPKKRKGDDLLEYPLFDRDYLPPRVI